MFIGYWLFSGDIRGVRICLYVSMHKLGMIYNHALFQIVSISSLHSLRNPAIFPSPDSSRTTAYCGIVMGSLILRAARRISI